ncbi:trinucleotide repeat-containing gene 18 protein-like isoform X2 [Mizuhopecten yessoensis]|uniref:trinucleotide repeat-containing gene 18 protein-like isoform X2 n=1 Tax=Mizuhopecten yessoensis TaxID=6573 RepID=UPI000B45BC90|nr:trinucleotide repeat-containing gene 18 protein-like isoform X2 [Mizuhopecten yessoensis]
MDAPLDFTLDRARLIGANAIGTYETGFDAAHSAVLGRPGAGATALQDIARGTTPTTSQYQAYPARYLPSSLPIPSQGGGYSMMSSFLSSGGGGAPMGDHLKAIIPDFQYWNNPSDGCARYIVNNNTIYSSPYLNYLPATESLSLFAHNVGVVPPPTSGPAPIGYHRMYDLQKEALYNGTPHVPGGPPLYQPTSGVSPPSTRASESLTHSGNLAVKKESGRHGDTKRSSESKHVTKSVESQKTLINSKHSKDPDKKSDSKKYPEKSDRLGEVKQEHTKACSKQHDNNKEVVVPTSLSANSQPHVKAKSNSTSPTRAHVDKRKHDQDISPSRSRKEIVLPACDKESDKSETINKSDGKVESLTCKNSHEGEKECKEKVVPTLTTVTMTSDQSVTSPQLSPKSVGMVAPPLNRGGLSPESSAVPVTSDAITSTTFSLPYYHSIYSHSQPSIPDGKKVHAPTFTPEIGTLPSVVAMTTMPVQTTACDMTIKKERGSYSCCKDKCATSVSPCAVTHQPCVSPSKPGHDKRETTRQSRKSSDGRDAKSKKTPKVFEVGDKNSRSPVNASGSSQSSVSPVIQTKQVVVTKPENVSNSVQVLEKAAEKVKPMTTKEQHVVPIRATTEGSVKTPISDDTKITMKGLAATAEVTGSKRAMCDGTPSPGMVDPPKTACRDNEAPVTCVKVQPQWLTSEDSTRTRNNPKTESAVKPLARSVQHCKSTKDIKSKLHEKSLRSRESRRKCDSHGKDDSSSSLGMNIPIGIAVAQKREEFKEENIEPDTDPTPDLGRNPGDVRRSPGDGESHPITAVHHRGDGQPSAFAGPIISKSTSPNAPGPDMRNTLPANLIVTGSATGAGIAWSDDPAARHFPSPWLQTGHGMNPASWIGQMPFTLPPNIPTTSGTTDPSQLPVSVPPGYKLVQDSVTGHLIIMPASNIEMYDPSRMWPGGFPSTTHPNTFQQIMAVHQQNQIQHQVIGHPGDRQPTTDFALAVQQYQQQLQHIYQSRPETGTTETCAPPSGQASIIDHSKSFENTTSKEIHSSSKAPCPSTDADHTGKPAAVVPHPPIQDLTLHNGQSLSYQYPALPLVYSPSLVPAIPIQDAVKTETSTVQSRGTSPMVPASEIDDTSQEVIDAAPSTTQSMCDIVMNIANVSQSIASVQTCTTNASSSTGLVTSVTCSITKDKSVSNSVDESKTESCDTPIQPLESEIHTKSEKEQCLSKDGTPECKLDTKRVVTPSTSVTSVAVDEDVKSVSERSETKEPPGDVICVKQNETNQSHRDYNPFLDPQILQAADGLELLSTLAEIRAKCVTLETPVAPPSEGIEVSPQAPEDIKVTKETSGPKTTKIPDASKISKDTEDTIDKKVAKETEKAEKKVSTQEKPKPSVQRSNSDTPKQSRKRPLSRTRSIPAKSDQKSEPASYYTSTGLKIPQGEEEINAIELDMRIRLAELQRLYKEKQRQLARLHPKRETDDALSKRGPGRPRKRKHQTVPDAQKQEPAQPKSNQTKTKEPVVKKKKQAEELVDRVFRKTGGGFGMPLSKKLKANAMAALFKTQSGFTVKRKGITSSLPGGGKSCDSIKMNEKKPVAKKPESQPKTSVISKGNLKPSSPPDKKSVSSNKESFATPKIKSENFSSGLLVKQTKPKKSLQQPEQDKTHGQEDCGLGMLATVADDSGLGMLAKYASCAVAEHIPAKKHKKKREEGVCTTSFKPDVIAVPTDIPKNEMPASDSKEVNTACPSTNTTTPAVKRESESDSTPESSSSVNKKRKPGRPRKCNPNTTPGVTETIVARNSKNFFYHFHSFEDVVKAHSNTSAQERKTKVETSTPMEPLYLDQEWFIRRSERIFLSEPSPQPSPNTTNVSANTPKPQAAVTPPAKKSPPTTAPSPAKSKSEKAKLQKAKNIKELTQKVKNKYNKAFQYKSKAKDTKQKPKRKKERLKSEPIVSGYDSDSSGSDNIPLSVLREMPSIPEPRSCAISKDELADNLRVLVFKDGLFYEGAVQGIRPPDVYGVLIDNERGNRPHIYSQEEILKEVIVDVKPSTTRCLLEGIRVCAYWSQQFSCLYPGTVAKASPNPHGDTGSINVEFDDGDSGRIPLDHIRMLPKDFPHVSYDPNPLLLIGKRRRHTTSDSMEPPRKSQSSAQSSESALKTKRGPGRPPKPKKDDASQQSDASAAEEDEEEEVDVCGFDEDRDDVFNHGFSMESFRKERSKSSNNAKESDTKQTKRDRSSNGTGKDSESEVKSSGKKRKKDKEYSDDSKESDISDDGDDVSDDGSRSSDQGKTRYHCKDSSIKSKKLHVTSLIKAATFEYKSSGSLHILNRNKSESRIDNLYMESENDYQQWDGDSNSFGEDASTSGHHAKPKCTKRSLSTESKSKIAAFLPARQLWRWSGKCTKRPGLKGKAKKEFYKAIVRGRENILVGDCAVFLSTGRPHLPYIGRIDSMWEAWGGQMIVKVKWFYHPEETRGGKKLQDMKGALFQSLHIDENDVQTISHKCDVLSYKEFCRRQKELRKKCGNGDEQDVYYLAGTYEPTIGLLKFEKDIDIT